MINELRYCDKGKELLKLGFKNVCITNDKANKLYKHMTRNNMVFLKDSYGTIINKDYDKFFKRATPSTKEYNELWRYANFLDHKNILRSKDYGIYILTSSPNRDLFEIKTDVNGCYVFAINPLFLDYYGFIGKFSGCNIAYVYEYYLDEFYELVNDLREYYGFNVFIELEAL